MGGGRRVALGGWYMKSVENDERVTKLERRMKRRAGWGEAEERTGWQGGTDPDGSAGRGRGDHEVLWAQFPKYFTRGSIRAAGGRKGGWNRPGGKHSRFGHVCICGAARRKGACARVVCERSRPWIARETVLQSGPRLVLAEPPDETPARFANRSTGVSGTCTSDALQTC
jgi:hypothetical protein